MFVKRAFFSENNINILIRREVKITFIVSIHDLFLPKAVYTAVLGGGENTREIVLCHSKLVTY